MWCYQVVSSSHSAHADSCTPTWLQICHFPHRWTLQENQNTCEQPLLRQSTYSNDKAGCSTCTLEGYKPLHALTLPLQPCPGAGSTRMQASRSSWDFPFISEANPPPRFANNLVNASTPPLLATSYKYVGKTSSLHNLEKPR